MCGIAGIINTKDRIQVSEIQAMTDIIAYRGPDDEGFLLYGSGRTDVIGKNTPDGETNQRFPEQFADQYHLAFGHRRLSILDLSAAGHQPMSERTGKLWITYNGEIYNYKELKIELMSLGFSFNSETDTEVILNAYRCWGSECLHRFKGMWAFAILDTEENEVFLSRDRFGIKPLYYWISPNGTFYFGSEIKQFTTVQGWKAILNKQRAADYLVYSLTDHTKETLFEGVYNLQAGHYIKLKLHQDFRREIPTSVKWYHLKQKKNTQSFESAASEFEKLFKESVKLHLRADVPIGSALSGGLDSSAIVCEINNLLRQEGKQEIQKTFSSCAMQDEFNEKSWVDIVVEKTKVDASYVYPKGEDIFRLTEKLIWHHDEPYQSQSAFLGYHVFGLAASKGVTVLLNGQGADEYLGGYSQFQVIRWANYFKRLQWLRLFSDIKHTRKYVDIPFGSAFKQIGYQLLPIRVKRIIARRYASYTDIKDLFDFDSFGICDIHPYEIIPEVTSDIRGIVKHFLFHSTLPKYLRWEDRNSMAHSIEARVPFLDHDLVEFCFSLPAEYLERDGVTKRIMRKGLQDILPSAIKDRKDKKGFITPEEHWVKKEFTNIFRHKIEEAIKLCGGLVKSDAIEYYDKVASSKLPFNYTYWRIILFAEWVKRFKVQIQ